MRPSLVNRLPLALRGALERRPVVTPFPASDYPRKLNLGCGFDHREGYVNVDFLELHKPDVIGDVRWLPALPTGYYTEIVAQDVLEHLERQETQPALREWRRLLAPGGKLWLRVPDLQSLLRRLDASDDIEHQKHTMHMMFGTQVYKGDYHHAGYTDILLMDELLATGYERPEAELRDDWLWEATAWAPPADRPPVEVGTVWGTGFYRAEGDGGGVWRWAQGRSELVLYARSDVDVKLAWTIQHGTVEAGLPGGTRSLEPGHHELDLSLNAGTLRVPLRCENRVEAPGDERELSFSLTDFALTVAPG